MLLHLTKSVSFQIFISVPCSVSVPPIDLTPRFYFTDFHPTPCHSTSLEFPFRPSTILYVIPFLPIVHPHPSSSNRGTRPSHLPPTLQPTTSNPPTSTLESVFCFFIRCFPPPPFLTQRQYPVPLRAFLSFSATLHSLYHLPEADIPNYCKSSLRFLNYGESNCLYGSESRNPWGRGPTARCEANCLCEYSGVSVCLGVEPNLGLLTRVFFFSMLLSSLCGAPSLTRGRACRSFVNTVYSSQYLHKLVF
jgi:hypothetical protein